jgi:hypothetical protein
LAGLCSARASFLALCVALAAQPVFTAAPPQSPATASDPFPSYIAPAPDAAAAVPASATPSIEDCSAPGPRSRAVDRRPRRLPPADCVSD